MTDTEKIKAFDDLASALTNCWASGSWSWWNPTPACGTAPETMRQTQAEAVADLVAWAKRTAPKQRKRNQQLRIAL